MTLEELNVVITAQNEKFSKQIKDVQSQLANVKTASDKASKSMSGLFNLSLITAGIRLLKSSYSYLSKLVSANQATVESEAKLAEVMRTRMNATNGDISAILKLISAEEKLGVIAGAVQTAGAQELATYATRKTTLEGLIPVLNDIVAQQYGYNATAENSRAIATMLGKVLSGQTSALSRYGYTFTEAQEQILKYGTEAEKVATLTEVVGEAVGDMNHALGQTPQGQLVQIKNSLGNIATILGGAILEPLNAALPTITKVISKLEFAAKYISAVMKGLFGSTDTTGTTDGVKEITDANEDLADSVEDVNKAYQEGTSSVDDFNVASGFTDEVSSAEELDDILSTTADDTAEVEQAMAEMVQPLVDFLKNHKDELLNTALAISMLASPITRVATIIGVIVSQLKTKPELFESLGELLPKILDFTSMIGEQLVSGIISAIDIITQLWQALAPGVETVLVAIYEIIQELLPAIEAVINLVGPVLVTIATGLSTIFTWLDSIGALKPLIMTLVAALIAWKVATLALTAAQWLHNASLLAKIGLMTLGVGLVIAGIVGAASAAMASKANEIPQYASGAEDIPRGQLFIAREAGPELVGTTPSGSSAVMNNMQIVEAVSQGVAQAIENAGGLGGGTAKVEIAFNSTEAARILRPKLQYENNRVGGGR